MQEESWIIEQNLFNFKEVQYNMITLLDKYNFNYILNFILRPTNKYNSHHLSKKFSFTSN